MRVQLIDHMGSDLSVVNAARVSFARQADTLAEPDLRLIAYLARHQHWTPFAHTAITLRVVAPLPIRTQCFKHKTGLVENEESRRYICARPELFVPEVFRSAPAGSIKQGSGAAHPHSEAVRARYADLCGQALNAYQEMIQQGVCPEQARFILPQGVMVSWIWTGNLAAYARFYNQRTDPHAQQEIQELARHVGQLVEPLFPHSWNALTSP